MTNSQTGEQFEDDGISQAWRKRLADRGIEPVVDLSLGGEISLDAEVVIGHTGIAASVYIDGSAGGASLRMNRAGLARLIEKLQSAAEGMDHYFERPIYNITEDRWFMPQKDGSFLSCDYKGKLFIPE